jgi:hypothetical protein
MKFHDIAGKRTSTIQTIAGLFTGKVICVNLSLTLHHKIRHINDEGSKFFFAIFFDILFIIPRRFMLFDTDIFIVHVTLSITQDATSKVVKS